MKAQGNALGLRPNTAFALKGQNKQITKIWLCPFRARNYSIPSSSQGVALGYHLTGFQPIYSIAQSRAVRAGDGCQL